MQMPGSYEEASFMNPSLTVDFHTKKHQYGPTVNDGRSMIEANQKIEKT